MDKLYVFASKFKLLYRIPTGRWLLIIMLFLTAWTLLMMVFQFFCKPVKDLNILLMMLGMIIVLLVSFIRHGSTDHRVILIPLRVLFGQKAPGDYWHVTVMNIVLYVPFACGLVFCLRSGCGWFRHFPAIATVLICFLFSSAVELSQFLLGSGVAEVDDVLMNTLGGAIGTIPYSIICR